MLMNTLFFTLQHRRSTKTLRIHYGLEGMKYIIQIYEGEINGHGEKEGLPTEYQYEFEQEWMRDLGVEDVSDYSTHSVRKTKSSVIYDRTKNVDAVRRLLGQSSVTATSAYLGISDESALDLARTINI